MPRSVPDEPPVTPGQSWGAASPEADGASDRAAPDDVPPPTTDRDPDERADNGPGEAAASPK